MQMRPQGLLYVTTFAALSAGCAITATTDEDALAARLPTGVTLLESDRNECAGAVAIDETVLASSRRDDLVIQRGQNATFRVDVDDDDDVEIEWTCVGSARAEQDSVECPDDTTHVRITRSTTGDEFLLECYGESDRSARRR